MRYFLFLIPILLFSCSNEGERLLKKASKSHFAYDENSYVVFHVDSLKNYPLGFHDHLNKTFSSGTFKSTTLTEEEFELIEKLTIEKFQNGYNKSKAEWFDSYKKGNLLFKGKGKRFVISDYSVYKRQYLPYINENGEKMVWMNCSCDERDDKWKKQFIMVHDGGKCYFDITINLTKKEVVSLWVNGSA